MIEPKEQVIAAIHRAQAELGKALSDLERQPAFDAGAVAYSAHALSNFLTVVDCTCLLLRRSLAEHPDPQTLSWVEGVQQASSMMSHIVADLMKGASLQHAPELKFEAVNLATMVRRGCFYYQQKAEKKGIRLECVCASDGIQVWADRVALAAILDNLLSNAVKYSPQRGDVRVTLRRDHASAILEVRDQGVGLSQEDQARLFRKGVRLSSVPTGGEPSNGFGLAIARELTLSLHGTLRCESKPGQGCAFFLQLPLYDEAKHAGKVGAGVAGSKPV